NGPGVNPLSPTVNPTGPTINPTYGAIEAQVVESEALSQALQNANGAYVKSANSLLEEFGEATIVNNGAGTAPLSSAYETIGPVEQDLAVIGFGFHFPLIPLCNTAESCAELTRGPNMREETEEAEDSIFRGVVKNFDTPPYVLAIDAIE